MAKRKAGGSSNTASKRAQKKGSAARPRGASAATRTARPAKTRQGGKGVAKKAGKTGTKKASAARALKARPAPAKKGAKAAAAPKTSARARAAAAKKSARKAPAPKAVAPKKKVAAPAARKAARPATGRRKGGSSLESRRRELESTVPSPPSSLNMNRRGSAVRTGRAEMAEHREEHASLTPSITGGDVDADVENAYFSGDEAPGGDNPTPDQDIVDDIGRALGVEYQDNEELRASDKVADRDRHRWELDPASSEDYRDRD